MVVPGFSRDVFAQRRGAWKRHAGVSTRPASVPTGPREGRARSNDAPCPASASSAVPSLPLAPADKFKSENFVHEDVGLKSEVRASGTSGVSGSTGVLASVGTAPFGESVVHDNVNPPPQTPPYTAGLLRFQRIMDFVYIVRLFAWIGDLVPGWAFRSKPTVLLATPSWGRLAYSFIPWLTVRRHLQPTWCRLAPRTCDFVPLCKLVNQFSPFFMLL